MLIRPQRHAIACASRTENDGVRRRSPPAQRVVGYACADEALKDSARKSVYARRCLCAPRLNAPPNACDASPPRQQHASAGCTRILHAARHTTRTAAAPTINQHRWQRVAIRLYAARFADAAAPLPLYAGDGAHAPLRQNRHHARFTEDTPPGDSRGAPPLVTAPRCAE